MQDYIKLAISFLKTAEGYKEVPYKDDGGVVTNGYGNTRLQPNRQVNLVTAYEDLLSNIDYFDKQINYVVGLNILKLTAHQRAALLCFAFNAGVGKKTLWSLIKQLKLDAIPNELKKWHYIHVNGKAVSSKGLINRREAEVALWNTADLPQAPLPVPTGEVKKAPSDQAVKQTVIAAPFIAAPLIVVTANSYPHYLLPVLVGMSVLMLLWFIVKVVMHMRLKDNETAVADRVQSKSTTA